MVPPIFNSTGLQGPTNHRYDLIGEGSGPCEKSRGSECRAGQRGAVVSGGWSYLASCGDSEKPWAYRAYIEGMKYYTIPIYVEGLFHTVSHEKRILFTNRWSVVFGSDTPQGFDSMEDFVETLTTRAKGGNILFCRMECFPKDFSHDIQKWSFPIEMGIYWSWSVWFLALNLETPTKRLEFLVTACFAIYEHVIYVTNCNNIPTKICHVSPQKSKKNHHDALLRLVRFTISETSAYFLCFLPDAGCQGCNDWNHSSCMPGIWEGPAWSDMMTAFQIQLANGVWYLGWY